MKILQDKDFLSFKGKQESQYLISLSERRAEIQKRISDGVTQFGDDLPWLKTNDKLRLRPGEVTVWCGINGHGKSLIASNVMAHLMKTKKVLIASLEMPVEATGERMVRQISGVPETAPGYVDSILDWTDDRLWIYDQLDTVQPERIIGMCIYAFEKLGIDHIVIDSLMKCGVGSDNEKQAAFMDRICWAAKTGRGHIHLIHHIRKGQSEYDVPNKFDVRGAAEITDMCDNLYIVHRNKRKEDKVQKGEHVDNLEPDCLLQVEKQRHGEWIGPVALYFDERSHQFLSGPDGKREWFDIKPMRETA